MSELRIDGVAIGFENYFDLMTEEAEKTSDPGAKENILLTRDLSKVLNDHKQALRQFEGTLLEFSLLASAFSGAALTYVNNRVCADHAQIALACISTKVADCAFKSILMLDRKKAEVNINVGSEESRNCDKPPEYNS